MTSPAGFFEGTEMPPAGWWEALFPDPASVLAAVGVKPGMTVVDLCSGDGWFTLQIAKVARQVIAIDIDQRLLDVALSRVAEGGLANASFVRGDAYELAALVGSTVDFVFLANAFHGVPDRTRLVNAVKSSLKPSGEFAVVNWHQRPREETIILGEPRGPKTELRVSPDQTVATVEGAGLRLARLVEIPPYHYGAVFHRPEPSSNLSGRSR